MAATRCAADCHPQQDSLAPDRPLFPGPSGCVPALPMSPVLPVGLPMLYTSMPDPAPSFLVW